MRPCVQVPPSVRTGLDAVSLFASSAAKPGLIVFANLNPAAKVCFGEAWSVGLWPHSAFILAGWRDLECIA